MFGKKFFGTVALGSATVSLVGNAGQILAQNSGNSLERVGVLRLQKFVDWLGVSKSDFEQLCVKAEAEQGENNGSAENVYFTASQVGRVQGRDTIEKWISGSEKILAVSGKDYVDENVFKFLKKGRYEEYWYISFEEMKAYLQDLKNNPVVLEVINFKK